MTTSHEKIEDLLEALEEQKKNLIAASLVARQELLEGLDHLEDKVDDIDTDEIKMKLILAKLKVLEEFDELEEKFEELGGKAKVVADATEDEIKDGWVAAKKVVKDIEEKVTSYFT